MRLPSLSYLLNSFLGAARRFPLAVTAALIATFCGMFLIEKGDDVPEVFRMLLSCMVFFPLYIAAVAYREINHSSRLTHLFINLILIAGMGLYGYFWAPNPDDTEFIKIVRFFLFLSVTHLAVTFIPYLSHTDADDFWEYNRRLFIEYFTGLLYAVLIYAGVSFALLAVKFLFDVDFDEEIFGHLFVATAGIFHTSYFLSNFPNRYTFKIERGNFQRGFVNLVKFVFISLTALYFVILYAYGLKILFTWELPEGWVSKLVIGFSVAGILTYLLNYMLPKIEQSEWVKTYRKYYFFVLLPVVGLLFTAIFKRLNDYGFTEFRYFVLLTGIWLAVVSIYFIISKKDDIRFIPISLAAACLIAAIGGPLSAFSISERSQKKQLESILTDVGILKNGKIKKSVPELEGEQAIRINSIVRYLAESDHLDAIVGWMPGDSIPNKDKSRWNTRSAVLETMGVSPANHYDRNPYRYFTSYHSEPVDIKAYDYYSKFDLNNYDSNEENACFFKKTDNEQQIIFHINNQPVDTLDISNLMSILEKEFAGDGNLPIEQMSHLEQGNQYEYLLTFEEIQFQIETGTPLLRYARGNVFWK